MPVTSDVYELGNIKQSIAINSDLKYFKADVQIVSIDNTPYYMAFVPDDISSSQIKFVKIEEKVINTKISNSKNTPKSYSLVLKSDIPCKVQVSMKVEPIQNTIGNGNNTLMYVLLVLLILGGIYLVMKKRK